MKSEKAKEKRTEEAAGYFLASKNHSSRAKFNKGGPPFTGELFECVPLAEANPTCPSCDHDHHYELDKLTVARQRIRRFLTKLKFDFRVYTSPQLVPIMNQQNPVHNVIFNLFNT
jgi:hypothetical protein